MNSVTFKFWVTLEFARRHSNLKPKRFDFCIEHKPVDIYIRFGTKLYRQIIGIPMGTNCAPLVADLFLFCYEKDFMMSLSGVKQAEIIEAFKSTSRYLDGIRTLRPHYHLVP